MRPLRAVRTLRDTLRTRAALGLGPATAPVIVLLPLGALLGPGGAGILTRETLAHLDAVISVALATLGVFVGIAIGSPRPGLGRLLRASTTEGLITMAAVASTVYLLLAAWGLPLGLPPLVAACALGMAASASAAPYVADSDDPGRRTAASVADLDDILPMLLGSVVLSLAVNDVRGTVIHLLVTIAAGVGVGLAGWLLLERTSGAERGVYVIGTLALLGGCAAYLGTSALLAGLVAGVVWARTPGHTDRVAAADLRKLQHPLVVLLVIIAGALLEPTLAGVWLFAPYLLFRLAGKLAGGWVASLVLPGVTPSNLGAYLITPGVLGLAFILNLYQVAPEAAGPLVLAVAAGAFASEVLALVLTPAGRSV